MRIAHIANLAGVSTELAKVQTDQGHKAQVFVFDDITFKMFGGTKINYNSKIEKIKFFTKLLTFDIWHYHHPYGSLHTILDKIHGDRSYIKHFHGDELRTTLKRYNGFCIVSTPDLLQYAPNGLYIPNPVNLGKIDQILKDNYYSNHNKVRVIHYDYYKHHNQDSDVYSNVLNQLVREGKIELTTMHGLPHKEALRFLSMSDLVIGKIMPNIGWFGMFELEGMAMKKPVVCYVDQDLYDKYKPAVFNITAEHLRQGIEYLIESPNLRAELGKKARTYIETNHDITDIANTIYKLYSKRIIEVKQ